MFKRFFSEEDGAVTVDYVVLVASVIGMGIAVIATVAGGAKSYSLKLNEELEDTVIKNLGS